MNEPNTTTNALSPKGDLFPTTNATRVYAKYPIKIGNVLVPAGTCGVMTTRLMKRLRESFPELVLKPGGQLAQVFFEDCSECLVKRDQLLNQTEYEAHHSR